MVLAALTAWGGTAVAADYGPSKAYAEVRALDKVAARTELLTVPVGQTVTFRALRITVDACRERPADRNPEAVAFLKIVEVEAEQPERPVFTGWMFAAAPAVSAMEDGVYNVWLIGCSDEAPAKDG